jgi:hypothetical protein
MRQKLAAFVAALAVLTAIGCGGGKAITEEDVNKANSSLVYGYIDMSEAPTSLQRFQIKQVRPVSDSPYWGFGTQDGVFMHSALPPGSYQFHNFGGMSGINAGIVNIGGKSYTYNFPGQGGGFRVEAPGLHYLGTYKYKKAGTFFHEKFDIQKAAKPTEKEILQMMLPRMTHAKWQRAIKKRIAELSK